VKDKKHNKAAGNNADDNEEQGRAGVACSLFRRWNGRFHVGLDAGSLYSVLFFEELSHSGGGQLEVGFERPMTRNRTVDGNIFSKTSGDGHFGGFLRKSGELWWFFDGQIVVECW